MSREEILLEIEHLRARLYNLIDAGASFDELLQASQMLDNFIVMYHRVAA
ncbi:aspartyl-phosphate phosphatase Spo0E family protein [Desulfallas thermosapovorans]|uniref:Spo0E like sporulation regulatory protein n=1 Tax=Desulfallas thermosapovorans DSM 6562 TaxID=1121431 RepID=A0A5S4ZNA4_9FIRM|nr:aspartyl-phosphate phosphatase Spo0E family protein [Desulfallas thermosapovorans]TYO93331.1 Spo0E like sporulation regulatory protein [Desulfallas thermosapovorans DSM 6562]